MKLNKTLYNLRQTKESFFNLEHKTLLTFDILKKDLTYYLAKDSTSIFRTNYGHNYNVLKEILTNPRTNIYFLNERFLVKIPL